MSYSRQKRNFPFIIYNLTNITDVYTSDVTDIDKRGHIRGLDRGLPVSYIPGSKQESIPYPFN